jgi:hypothetical protein
VSDSPSALALKFAERTFRFVRLSLLEDGPQLTAAGAGLIPFDAKERGRMLEEGSDRLSEALDRTFDRLEVERGGVVVVLDGRAVLRALFPVPEELAADHEAVRGRAHWEIARRLPDGSGPESLHIEYALRGNRNGHRVVDAWGVFPETLNGYDRVVQGTGCHVAAWDCDPWAIQRLYEQFIPADHRADLTALVHIEAESMEVGLIDDAGSVFLTSPQADTTGPFQRAWDPDDTDDVAREVSWWVQELQDRWLTGARQPAAEVKRLLFTGSVDEPGRLLASLTRVLPMRIEELDLHEIVSMHESVASSPMIRGSLGSFALSAGGALSGLRA